MYFEVRGLRTVSGHLHLHTGGHQYSLNPITHEPSSTLKPELPYLCAGCSTSCCSRCCVTTCGCRHPGCFRRFIYIYIYMDIYIYININVCIYIYTYAYIYIHTYMDWGGGVEGPRRLVPRFAVQKNASRSPRKASPAPPPPPNPKPQTPNPKP